MKFSMKEAHLFARKNLKVCCAELIIWDSTGVLPEGRVRELRDKLKSSHDHESLRIAQNIVKDEALNFVIENFK